MPGPAYWTLLLVNETELGTWAIISSADPVVKLTLVILLLFSVISWGIIVFKAIVLTRAKLGSDRFVRLFWNSANLDEAAEAVSTFPGGTVAQVFRSGYKEMKEASKKQQEPGMTGKLSTVDMVRRAMIRETTVQLSGLERLVAFLATVGSASPFIGLFGTVWGIMRAFQTIGITGETSLQTVGPHISEALIATAVGLFAAIPAVMFYNYFVGRIRSIGQAMDNFTHDFLNIVERHYGN